LVSRAVAGKETLENRGEAETSVGASEFVPGIAKQHVSDQRVVVVFLYVHERSLDCCLVPVHCVEEVPHNLEVRPPDRYLEHRFLLLLGDHGVDAGVGTLTDEELDHVEVTVLGGDV